MPWLSFLRKKKQPLVYLGPSLPLERAREILDAEYRPPIRRGDLPRDLAAGFRVFGIVDGVFHQDLSVSVREIRRAIEAGAKLYGSSSMGALRAAETYPLGMEGVGEIYRWYREEVVDSDDEVALTFDPETGRPLSLPLVNVRATLREALSRGSLERGVHDAILNATVALPFPRRNPENIRLALHEAGMREAGERAHAVLSRDGVDLKARDAEALLRRIAEAHV